MDGFAREFQTGAEGFGRKVSMTCDHPAINPALQKDQDAQTTILRLFERKAEGIYPEGAHLWVYRDGDAMPDEHDGTQSERLRAALAAVPAANLDLLHDRFFWRALLVESIPWSLAIYGVAALAEFRVRAGSLYFDQAPLVGIGLVTTLVLFSGLVGLAGWLLRSFENDWRMRFIVCDRPLGDQTQGVEAQAGLGDGGRGVLALLAGQGALFVADGSLNSWRSTRRWSSPERAVVARTGRR
jgi:hypothetical protein